MRPRFEACDGSELRSATIFPLTDELERSKNRQGAIFRWDTEGVDDERATGTDSVAGIHINCGAFSCYLSFSGDLLRWGWLLWSTRVSSSAAPIIYSFLSHFLFIFSWFSLTRNFNVGFLRTLMLRKSRKLTINSRWNSELFYCLYFLAVFQ